VFVFRALSCFLLLASTLLASTLLASTARADGVCQPGPGSSVSVASPTVTATDQAHVNIQYGNVTVVCSTRASLDEVRNLVSALVQKQRTEWQAALSDQLGKLNEIIEQQAKLDAEIKGQREELDKLEGQQRGDQEAIAELKRWMIEAQRVQQESSQLRHEQRYDEALHVIVRTRDPPQPPVYRWVGVIAGSAAGVLGTTVGTFYFFSAKEDWDEAQESCPNGSPCPPGSDGPELSRSAESNADKATVFYGIGIAGFALAAASFIYGEVMMTPSDDQGDDLSVSPQVSESAAGLSLSGAF